MKKFYISIFTAVLLFATLMSQAQVYNSITNGNPLHYTLDDPRFWQGGVPPPNPCNSCTIKISSPVAMVHCCGLSTSPNTIDSAVFTTQVPAGPVFNTVTNDGQPVGTGITVGMRFQSTIANASINGARFYKLPGMNGVHIALLYNSAGGAPLQSAVFANESASGWQTQSFPLPISNTVGTTYVIAVFFASGNYTATNNFFTSAVTNGNLTAPANVPATTPNGTYAYGTAATFPGSTSGTAPNYWVDVSLSGTDGIWLNDVSIAGSTINLYGTTDLSVNTYLQLFGSSITLGNDPTSVENIFINDQLFLRNGSSIRLANPFTIVDANNNPPSNPVIGPYAVPGLGRIAGIFTDRPAGGPNAGSIDLTLTGPINANFNGTTFINPYLLNCGNGDCGSGIVVGPAITISAPADLVGNFYSFAQSTTLPVVLVKLIATNDGNGGVKVSWSTSQEQNSGYFDVERSSDQTGWTKIGSVKAVGYSSTTTDYSFTDKIPLDGQGYYRLKMVDIDGKFKYSKAVSVDNGSNDQPLVIYSNPFSDQIRLKVNVSRAQNLTLSVSDMLGKTYISQSYNAQQGDNFINLRSNAGGTGMYILRIHGDSYEQTVKLEKQ